MSKTVAGVVDLANSTANTLNMVLNHLLDSQFKTFMEFLPSLLQFTLNPVILEQLERGKLWIPILNDFPAGDRTLVLILQGDGTVNRQ